MRILLIFIVFLISCQKKNNEQIKISNIDSNKTETINADSIKTIKNNVDSNKSQKIEPHFPVIKTSVRSKNLTFEINLSEQVNLKNPFTKSEEEFQKLCDTINYQHYPVFERAKLIEKYSLKKDLGFVSRQGDNLQFNLKNGKKKILSNNDS